ncbi:PIG-L deacetylase family protein [Massilia eburnea]|uniref:PIG-L deacetylase family protein n=1 Tax=Massilia eburnea TaxID=1776165 RepID=UPI003D6B6EE5
MLTNPESQPAALFLFAHQDDEFGVFQQILNEQQSGRMVLCAYLTDGASPGVTPAVRNAESLRVLAALGVQEQNVIFAGEQLGIRDATLPENMSAVEQCLRGILSSYAIERLYVTAWEGGHHDHDALHAVTVRLCYALGRQAEVSQYSLYNGKNCPGPFFSVLKPLSENGCVEKLAISFKNRLRFLRYCLSYPSQRKTWIGLFPFVTMRYVFTPYQQLQGVSLDRLRFRPHAGDLYYEKRNFFTWHRMDELVNGALAEK